MGGVPLLREGAEGEVAGHSSVLLGRTVFEQHRDHFAEVLPQFVERLTLAMGAGEAWHVPDEEAGRRVALDHRRVGFHGLAPAIRHAA